MIKYLQLLASYFNRRDSAKLSGSVRSKKHSKTSSKAKSLFMMIGVASVLLLSGCRSGILDPQGPIADYQLKLLIFAILLMLIVVLPVIFLTLWFAWRYRASATKSKYRPEWSHSTPLEIVWWTIPCVIIGILSVVTWRTTHSLSPYKPLVSDKKPVEVQVVSLDWKWMFIYPQYHIATINRLVIPTGRPINFKITSAAPMNSFLIPQLGGQIMAMAGMVTQLHLQADHPGEYRGFSANYTGAGFAHMEFYTKATSDKDFQAWVASVKAKHNPLTWNDFWQKLFKPSIANPVTYYSSVDQKLFMNIVMSYMKPNYKPSGSHMAALNPSYRPDDIAKKPMAITGVNK